MHALSGGKVNNWVEDAAVMGVIEVLKRYSWFKERFREMLGEAVALQPDVLLLVDYPGFNLRLASELKKRGVKVLYYVCPQVWAWNRGRIPKMAKIIDRLMVIFPFEVAVFKDTDLRVDFVGNPLVAQIDEFLAMPRQELPWGSEQRVALLPGSRKQEILRILPSILSAAKRLEARFPDVSFMIASPNERIEALVNEQIALCTDRPSRLAVVCGHARALMHQADAAMVTSGTATLETALLGTPQIIVYKTSPATYWFARTVLTIRHIGLVNIVAKRSVCPELIQQDATPAAMADGIARLLGDTKERSAMRTGYEEVRQLLGARNAAENAAEILLEREGGL